VGACPHRNRSTDMDYPKRKYPRLKKYDYRLPGYYYITIHAYKDSPALSFIQKGSPEKRAEVMLTKQGHIAQQQLLALQQRYDNLKVDKYVIMPTHIHIIFQLLHTQRTLESSPSIPSIVGTYKSITTRAINQACNTPGRKLFQTSFFDSVLRSEKAYQECWLYIDRNPDKWSMQPDDL